MEDKIPIIYEDIVQEINYDTLPNNWIKTNLESFSKDIQLFEYQQNALKNAIKLLYNYFEEVKPYQILESETEGIERKKEWCNNYACGKKITLKIYNPRLKNKITNGLPIIVDNLTILLLNSKRSNGVCK